MLRRRRPDRSKSGNEERAVGNTPRPAPQQNIAELERAASQAEKLTSRSTWSEKARYLQELFGQRLAAAVTGVDDARTVGHWIHGREPDPAYHSRLRDAYQVTKFIELAESKETAQAWFFGMNPGLGDISPAQVIAEDLETGGRRVMKATRTVLTS
jgi:hypothetical protein